MIKKIFLSSTIGLTALLGANSQVNALENTESDFEINDTSTIENDFNVMGLDYNAYYNEAHETYTYSRNVVVAGFESFEHMSDDVGLYVYSYNPYEILKETTVPVTVNGIDYTAKLLKLDTPTKISKYEISEKIFNTSESDFRRYSIEKFNNEGQVLVADFSNYEDSVNFNFDSILPISASKYFTMEYSNLKQWGDIGTILKGGITSSSANYSQHWYIFNTPTEIDKIKQITIDYAYVIETSSGPAFKSWTDAMFFEYRTPIVTYSEEKRKLSTVNSTDFFTIDYKEWGGTLPCISNTETLFTEYAAAFAELGYEQEHFKYDSTSFYQWAICYDLTPNTFASSAGINGILQSDWENEEFWGSRTVIKDATMFSCVYEKDGVIYNALAMQRTEPIDGGIITIGDNGGSRSIVEKIKLIIKIVLGIITALIILKIIPIIINAIVSVKKLFKK